MSPAALLDVAIPPALPTPIGGAGFFIGNYKLNKTMTTTNDTALALGYFPGQENIPEKLLEVMAIILSRKLGVYVSTMDCRGAASLVAWSFGVDLRQLPKTTNKLPDSVTQIIDQYYETVAK